MKLAVSFFKDRNALTIERRELEWDALCDALADPREYESKEQAPWIKLAEFGDVKSAKGSLRTDENIKACSGVEADYDGEVMQPEEAAQRLGDAGVRAFVYTSPSHTAEAPRWRVLSPFDTPDTPDARRAACEKLNGILGGVLSRESFTASQSYYFGRIRGRLYQTFRTLGRFDVRGLDIPRVVWRGSEAGQGSDTVASDVFVDMILSGEEIHPAIAALAWRGWTAEELTELVGRSLLMATRPDRARVAIEGDIPRAVASAQDKRTRALEAKLAALPVPPEYARAPAVQLPEPDEQFSRLRDRTATFNPLVWLIRDHIEHPTLAMCFGESNIGKSFVLCDMAVSIALGRPWQGFKTRKARVVYLAGEGFQGINRRFLAWKLHYKITDAEWDAADMYVSNYGTAMTDAEDMKRLWERLDKLRPDFLIIDTLNRMTPGMDQNTVKEMSGFVKLCDDIKKRYGCTVLIVHHSGKSNTGAAMGSVALKGACDVEFAVLKTKQAGVIKLVSTKMKDSEPFEDRELRFVSVELPWPETRDEGEAPRMQRSAVLELVKGTDGMPVPPSPGEKASKGRDLIKEIIRNAGGKIEKRELLEEFCRLRETGTIDTKRSRFYILLADMKKAGHVIVDDLNDVTLVM